MKEMNSIAKDDMSDSYLLEPTSAYAKLTQDCRINPITHHNQPRFQVCSLQLINLNVLDQ